MTQMYSFEKKQLMQTYVDVINHELCEVSKHAATNKLPLGEKIYHAIWKYKLGLVAERHNS